MSFDVPKVVRSPGCDHGLDEESRNGRDIKIYILDDYIWTPERFRVRLGQYRISGRLSEPPGGIWALLGLSGKEGEEAKEGAPPPQAQTELGRGPAPPFLLPSPLFLPSPPPNRKGGSPTLGWGWTPPYRRAPPRPASSYSLLYIRGQGAPQRHKLIFVIILLAVCGAPLHHNPL